MQGGGAGKIGMLPLNFLVTRLTIWGSLPDSSHITMWAHFLGAECVSRIGSLRTQSCKERQPEGPPPANATNESSKIEPDLISSSSAKETCSQNVPPLAFLPKFCT